MDNNSNNKNTEFKVLIIIALVVVALEIICALAISDAFSPFLILVSLVGLISLSYISSVISYILNYKNFYTCDNCKYCYNIFKNNYITILMIVYVVVAIANVALTISCFNALEIYWPPSLIIVGGINLGFLVLSLPTKLIFSKYNLKLLNVEYLHQINKKLSNKSNNKNIDF